MFDDDGDEDFLSCGDDVNADLDNDLDVGSLPNIGNIGRALTGAVGSVSRAVTGAPASRPAVRVAPARLGVSVAKPSALGSRVPTALQHAAHEVIARGVTKRMTGGLLDQAHLQLARQSVKVPALDDAVALLRLAQNQREATSEHHRIQAREAFKKEVNTRLERIEKLLGANGVHIFLGRKAGAK